MLVLTLTARCDAPECGRETQVGYPMPNGVFGQLRPAWEGARGWVLPHADHNPSDAIRCPKHARPEDKPL
jgi:hypothetical protein